jgi:caa(3)-type oxidase subunit IV
MSHVSRKEYWVIFGALTVLTGLEVGIVYIPGIARGLMISALILLALAKAGLVGFFYMHLKHETKIMRWGIIIPLATPGVYAFVLMAEAAWRLVVT